MKKVKPPVKKPKFNINDFYQDSIEEDYSTIDSIFNLDDETFINQTLINMGLNVRKRL